MKKYLFIFFMLITCSFCGSVWKDEYSSVYGPVVARKTGDIILIKIDESNTATQKAQTDLKKNTKIEGDLNLNWSQVANFLNSNQSNTNQGKTGYNAQNNFLGTGTTGRSSKLQAQLTAIIYKVEGDNYYIRGSKKIIINSEEEEISMEGVIRSQDIAPDNSVFSSLINDAVLKIKGYGAVSNDQEKGFFGKLIDWLF
ncbi:MAG: flagellar basal body L-ring protein FlgH [Candidatus Margulisbacteria bacterium]|nr:flagellar basal body L-ring protein FlgH [Candidatus Margulisiibacteriota bacterium]